MKSMSFKDKFEKQVAESINGNEEVRDAVNGVVESRFDREKKGKGEIDLDDMKRRFVELFSGRGPDPDTAEKMFHKGWKDILEYYAKCNVMRIVGYDDEWMVFGWPAQVELDIVLKNGKLLIIEIKSSVSTGDLATFVKKAQFYEQRHNRKADALVIISPMIDDKAAKFIAERGIISYSYASDVSPDIV